MNIIFNTVSTVEFSFLLSLSQLGGKLFWSQHVNFGWDLLDTLNECLIV
jgi:hypothetical protein